ncbi:MAG TPA: nuclear transport factor 2 family protein [Polyangiaceae bacterium]|jgi:ketosteroid isomerase-like protein
MSRRYLLAAGAGSLALACGGAVPLPVPVPSAAAAPGMTRQEEIVRRWYAGWQQPDWGPLDALLTDDFAFSSAAGDDHISKSRFKKQCWETQIAFIGQFELESVLTKGDEAFVKYLCHTKNGKSLRNVEHLTLRGDKIASIECYFGAESSFPSAVSKE